jgi:LacI family transcriptional regulator
MSNKVSMKDVADRLKIHPSTVSLALKDSPRITPETRTLVKKTADDMGYRRNPYLSMLMQSRRKGQLPKSPPTFAFLTFHSTRDGWKKNIYNIEETFKEGERYAGMHGCKLEEIWMPLEKYTPARIGDILHARGISGVILSPFPLMVRSFDWQWERFHTVAIGPSLHQENVHRVRMNHFKSMNLIMEECRKLGYRRIGLYLRREVSLRMNSRWLGAFLAKKFEWGGKYCLPPRLTECYEKDDFITWVRDEKPDLIVTTHLKEAEEWLSEAGYSIPGDIGLTSLSEGSPAGGKRSGIYENWELHGERAIKLLLSLIANNEFGINERPYTMLIEGIWNQGTSIRSMV